MPTTISSGQTPLTVQDAVNRLQAKDTDYFKGSPDWYTPFAIALPKYAADYEGNYYFTPSQSGAFANLPTPQSVEANGKIYEIPFPSDALNDGIADVAIEYGPSSTPVDEANVTEGAESTWDKAASNTTAAYWEQGARKVRLYVPTALSASQAKYSFGYTRYPTIPDTLTDQIDAPAEDIQTLLDLWEAQVQKD